MAEGEEIHLEELDGEEYIDIEEETKTNTDNLSVREEVEEEFEEVLTSPPPKFDNQSKQEYMKLILKVQSQNKLICELKKIICEKTRKSNRTKCENREIRTLKQCLEKENIKLKCLLRKILDIQEQFPGQSFSGIQLCETEENPTSFRRNYSCAEKDKEGSTISINSNDIERKIQGYLQECGAITKPTDCTQQTKDLCRSYKIQEKLATDNATLEGERYKLQEEILCRDRKLDSLQQKVQNLQCELYKVQQEQQFACSNTNNSKNCGIEDDRQFDKYKETANCLEMNIREMQCNIKELKVELQYLKNERKSVMQDNNECFSTKKPTKCTTAKTNDIKEFGKTKDLEFQQLKANYENLLEEFGRKDANLKMIQQKMQQLGCTIDTTENGGENENIYLRNKISDLQEEQEEFKCLLNEQSEQLEDYRNKYLCAQQKVEEQKCLLDKQELTNKHIENQINLEIQRIKCKFQEKLKELAPLPKLLENEQIKLANSEKDKEDLEKKIRLVCRELKILKSNKEEPNEQCTLKERIICLENQVAQLKEKNEQLLAEHEPLMEKLQKTKADLDILRNESAKIITRTKERADNQKEAISSHVEQLEKELAQCRATASLSIADREDVIKEMQEQLCVLSSSFNSAQMQIKTLKNHIKFLFNEKQNCGAEEC